MNEYQDVPDAGHWNDDEFEKAVQLEMKRLEDEMNRQMKIANINIDENLSTKTTTLNDFNRYDQEYYMPNKSNDDSFKKSCLQTDDDIISNDNNSISSKDTRRRKLILEQRANLESQIEETKQRKAYEMQRELEEDRMRLRNFQQPMQLDKVSLLQNDTQPNEFNTQSSPSSGKFRTKARAQMMRDVYGTMGNLLHGNNAQSSYDVHSPSNNIKSSSFHETTMNSSGGGNDGMSVNTYPEQYDSSVNEYQSPRSSEAMGHLNNSATWKPSNIHRTVSDSKETKLAQRKALDEQVAETRRRKEAEKLRDRYDDERRLQEEADETARVAIEKQRIRDELRHQEAEDLKFKQSRSESEALRRKGKSHVVNSTPSPLLTTTSQHISHHFDGDNEILDEAHDPFFSPSNNLPSIHEDVVFDERDENEKVEKLNEIKVDLSSPMRGDTPGDIVLTKDDIKKFNLLRRLFASDPSLIDVDSRISSSESSELNSLQVETRLLSAGGHLWNPSSIRNNRTRPQSPGYVSNNQECKDRRRHVHSSLPEVNFEQSLMSESLLLFVPISARSSKSTLPQHDRLRHERHQQSSLGVLQSLNLDVPSVQSVYESRPLPIRVQSNEPEVHIVPNSFVRAESGKAKSAPVYSSSTKLRPSTAAVSSLLPASRPSTPMTTPSSSLTHLPPLRDRPFSASQVAVSHSSLLSSSTRPISASSVSLPPIRPSSGLLRPSSSATRTALPESRPGSAIPTLPALSASTIAFNKDLFTDIERSTQSASLRHILEEIKLLDAHSVESLNRSY